ncbi:DUF2474 domain-containing protein [Massilia sp. ST3]|uniref:DUF2474 domain-containing protein n=1 Tax=Massilia sp. ST3 TaxID=2824903 RepID=UPI001B813861|nr:DUF2474 domain-containing protein [Massilia sp. ST3]MBQ5946137.1 DUF2474 domain-containing protein [Massilia sp. ST3]
MDTPKLRNRPSPREWLRRLAWMAALWLGGVATLALVAYALRLVMRAAGMR